MHFTIKSISNSTILMQCASLSLIKNSFSIHTQSLYLFVFFFYIATWTCKSLLLYLATLSCDITLWPDSPPVPSTHSRLSFRLIRNFRDIRYPYNINMIWQQILMQSPFFGRRKEAKSVRVCVLIACTFPMMAKVDFGKEADVGENKAISHAAIKKIKSQRVCLSYLWRAMTKT